MSGTQVRRLSHTHKAIMEFMIANPEMSNDNVAAQFGYTPTWLSQLVHSDLFQMELKYWQDLGLCEATLGIKDRLNDVAHQSLERLQRRLSTIGDQIPVDSLVDISEMALKSLGFGAAKTHGLTPGPQVFNNTTQINNFGNEPVDAKLLAEARARMSRLPDETRLIATQPLESEDVQRTRNSNSNASVEAGQLETGADQSSAGRTLRTAEQTGLAQAGN